MSMVGWLGGALAKSSLLILRVTGVSSLPGQHRTRSPLPLAGKEVRVLQQIGGLGEYVVVESSLSSSGAVRLCEESAWKETVQRLRDEQPGHFFAPVFPP